MAHSISELTRPVAPHSGFPYGDVQDDPGGTLANRLMVTDWLQFFQKLMNDAGITPNGTDDDSINGYQLSDALAAVVLGGFSGEPPGGGWNSGGTATITTVGGGTFLVGTQVYNKYKTFGKTIYWQIQLTVCTVAGSVTQLKIQAPPSFFSSGGTWANLGSRTLQHLDFGGVSNVAMNCELNNDTGGNPIIILTHPTGTFPTGANTNINLAIVAERT